MSFFDGLLNNRDFVYDSLLSLIDEERNRIVTAGLINAETCDRALATFLQKIADEQYMTKDEAVSKLTDLYDSMHSIKLAGDRLTEDTTAPNATSTPAPEFIEVEETDEQVKQAGALESIEQLERVAYKLGSCGNHKAAYEVEKVINQLKSEIGE